MHVVFFISGRKGSKKKNEKSAKQRLRMRARIKSGLCRWMMYYIICAVKLRSYIINEFQVYKTVPKLLRCVSIGFLNGPMTWRSIEKIDDISEDFRAKKTIEHFSIFLSSLKSLHNFWVNNYFLFQFFISILYLTFSFVSNVISYYSASSNYLIHFCISYVLSSSCFTLSSIKVLRSRFTLFSLNNPLHLDLLVIPDLYLSSSSFCIVTFFQFDLFVFWFYYTTLSYVHSCSSCVLFSFQNCPHLQFFVLLSFHLYRLFIFFTFSHSDFVFIFIFSKFIL